MSAAPIHGFRLSPLQRSLWAADGAARDWTQGVVLLEGALDRQSLTTAMQQLLNRHEILRTTFQAVPGMKFPLQVIAEHCDLICDTIDLRDQAGSEPFADLEQRLENERQRPIVDAYGSLLRLTLLMLAEDRHALLISLPSLCADAWTIGHLMQELCTIYGALAQGTASADVPLQYVDFAEWHNELLESEDADAGKTYWQTIGRSATPLWLPGETPLPAMYSGATAKHTLSLAPELVLELDRLAAQSDTSIEVLLLACWQSLLGYLTGQSEVVVEVLRDGRNHEALQGAPGLFAQWIPIASRIMDADRCSELVEQVAQSLAQAGEWQEYFIPSPMANSAPIGFMFEQRYAPQSVGGVRFTLIHHTSRTKHLKLNLAAVRMADELVLRFEYASGWFQAEQIARIAQQFFSVLHSVVEHPTVQFGRLDLVNAAERQQILETWNATQVSYPHDQCIHHLVEAQALRTPDATAIVFHETQVRYAELNQRANQIAHYLCLRGVQPGSVVGLCVGRSVDLVAGILGILKAGAAYVYLSPDYPLQRIAYLLSDTQAAVVITHERLLDRFADYPGDLICLDRDAGGVSAQPTLDPAAAVTPDHVAYIVYTSGSTGQPKGVVCAHRGVVNYVRYVGDTYQISPQDVVLQLAAPSFDASVRDIIAPLTKGARIVIVDDAAAKQPAVLRSVIKEQRVTCLLSIVPTMLRSLLEIAPGSTEESTVLRLILVSGEPLIWADCRAAQAVFGQNVLIVNQYGPTECTMTSTYYLIDAPQMDTTGAPVGRPIPNQQCYILNKQLTVVPVGVPGEILIGGIGLAYGYLDRPELTAERFIPNPFSSECSTGARLYRTGDLGRYLPDGAIEFLGRSDQQVKLKGVRVELGEIEAVLRQHPAVQATAAIVRDEPSHGQRLVAYVVSVPHQRTTTTSLRAFLETQVPEHLIPSVFVPLDALPLTVNGKLDRRALPPPDHSRPDLESAFVAPRTPLEVEVARIWSETLKLDHIGVYDNFFDLGGHSLPATQIIYQLNETFLVDLPLRTLFDDPTVAGVARVIESLRAEQQTDTTLVQWLDQIEQLSEDELRALIASEQQEHNRHG